MRPDPLDNLTLDPASDAPLYAQLKEALRKQLERGAFSESGRLPTMRDIAEAAGVALRTVNLAVNELRDEGLVTARVGRGVFVRPSLPKPKAPPVVVYVCLHPHFMAPDSGLGFYRFQGISQAVTPGVEIHPATSAGEVDLDDLRRPDRGVLFLDRNFITDGFGPVSEFALEHGTPCCVVEPNASPHVSVDTQRALAYRLAAEHLLRLGHRRVAMIDIMPDPWGTPEDNRSGYAEALRHFGVSWDDALYAQAPKPEEFPESLTLEALDRVLSASPPPTALIHNNDTRALIVLRALRERGLRVPEDLSIMGCDNLRVAALAAPPLSTADTKQKGRGHVALEYVVALARGESPPAPVVTPELVLRGSTRPARRPTTDREAGAGSR